MRHTTLLLTYTWLVLVQTLNTRREISRRPIVSHPQNYHNLALLNAKLPNLNWKAPDYKIDYKLLRKAFIEMSHFNEDPTRPVFRNQYIALLNTILLLSKCISEQNWSYASTFRGIAFNIAQKSVYNPTKAMRNIMCYMKKALDSIYKMRQLITNQWVEFVCTKKPKLCDPVLFILKDTDKETAKQAELLEVLGNAAYYIMDYLMQKETQIMIAQEFHKFDIFKDPLQHIVNATAAAHKKIFGRDDICVTGDYM